MRRSARTDDAVREIRAVGQADGFVADLSAQPDSLTGRFLAEPIVHPLQPRREVVAPGKRAAEARAP